jgi:hypothetical protein
MRRWVCLSSGVDQCYGECVPAGKIQWRWCCSLYKLSNRQIWEFFSAVLSLLYWIVSRRLVWCCFRTDDGKLYGAVYRGVLLSGRIDQQHRGQVPDGALQSRWCQCMHELSRWSIWCGARAQHVWLYWYLHGGILLSCWVDDSEQRGVDMYRGQVQLDRCRRVLGVCSGSVWQHIRTQYRGMQWLVCSRALWQHRQPHDVDVQWIVRCWVRVFIGIDERDCSDVWAGNIQLGRRERVYSMSSWSLREHICDVERDMHC